MFNYQEPEASTNQDTNPEAKSLPLPPSGANTRASQPLNPEKVHHMLFGSLAGIDRTIKILHALGYADPNNWSEPIPTEKPGQWMAILTKTLLLEQRP